jgi:hypothetical protein
MKATLILCALAANGICATPLLNRVTPAALSKLQAQDPMSRLVKPEEGKIHVLRPGDQSILKDSTLLHDGKHWTLVPIGAVVHTPENLKSRVIAEPTGQLLGWRDFLAANHGWISTCEMDFEQAAGKTALPEDTPSNWSKQGKIVVAVHQHGPISARLKKAPTPPTP